MLQSVYTTRCLLHVAALLLAVCAVLNQSWDEIELGIPAPRIIENNSTHSSFGNNSTLLSPENRTVIVDSKRSRSVEVEKVTFAPGRCCVHHANNATSAVCHEYAFLLTRIGSITDSRESIPRHHRHHHKPGRSSIAVHADKERDVRVQMEQDKQIDRVLTSWCRIQEDGSWFVQGAESMVCLVVLDSCLYTMVFWVICGSLATCVSLLGLLWPTAVPIVESFHALCSYVTAILGFFLVVEWWGYGAYFIDQVYLHSLSLSWKYGSAFLVLIASTLLSTLAARITWHMSITTRSNCAQLHAATPTSLENAATPAAAREQQLQECQHQNADPLQCPPNYQV